MSLSMPCCRRVWLILTLVLATTAESLAAPPQPEKMPLWNVPAPIGDGTTEETTESATDE